MVASGEWPPPTGTSQRDRFVASMLADLQVGKHIHDHHPGSPSRRVNCMQQQHTVTSEGSLQQRLSFGNNCFRRW